MLEETGKILDNGGTFGALLTDLSKTFTCITRDLLIAKLHSLNFNMNALNSIFNIKESKLIPVSAHIWIYF